MAETATKPRAKPRATKAAAEKVARSYFDAVAERDADRVAGHWHREGILEMLPIGVFRGPGEVAGFLREEFAAMPNYELMVERIIAAPRVAVVQWRSHGTFTGRAFRGVEPTGRLVEVRGVHCMDIENGKVTHATVYFDGLQSARSIGLLPPRDSTAESAIYSAFNAATKLRAALRDR